MRKLSLFALLLLAQTVWAADITYDGGSTTVTSPVTSSGNINVVNGATVTVSGDGALLGSKLNMQSGTVVVDNSAGNLTNNNWGTNLNPNGGNGTFRVIGNGTLDTVLTIGGGNQGLLNWFSNGLLTMDIQHGASANASVVMGCWNWNTDNSSAILKLNGNDLGAATGFNSRLQMVDGPYVFVPGAVIIGNDYATYNGYGTSGLGFVSMDTGASARQRQINSAVSTDNVLIDSLVATPGEQTLAAGTTVRTLKIDGAYPLNLGGNTLTIGDGATSNISIIQTGAANEIKNGKITGTGIGARVYNESDLTISAAIEYPSVAGYNGSLTKAGTGKLTLSGPIGFRDTPGAATDIYWSEGDLDVATPSSVNMYRFGLAQNGTLTKSGPGYLRIQGLPWDPPSSATANTHINVTGGTLSIYGGGEPPAMDLGVGSLTVSGGTLAIDCYYGGPITMAGGTMTFGGYSHNFAPTATITAAAGTTSTLNNAVNATVYGIGGTGILRKTGAGKLTVDGPSSTGKTAKMQWAEGDLQLGPDVNLWLAPDASGDVELVGGITSGGTLSKMTTGKLIVNAATNDTTAAVPMNIWAGTLVYNGGDGSHNGLGTGMINVFRWGSMEVQGVLQTPITFGRNYRDGDYYQPADTAKLVVTGPATLAAPITTSGVGIIETQADAVVTGQISFSAWVTSHKTGPGKLTLQGPVIYGDGSTLSWEDGSMAFNSSSVGSAYVNTAFTGNLEVNGPGRFNLTMGSAYSRTGSTVVNGGTLSLQSTADETRGAGLAPVVVNGGILAVNCLYGGPITLVGGRMDIGTNYNSQMMNGSVITAAAGTTSTIYSPGSGYIYGLAGSGTIVKAGSGAVYFTGVTATNSTFTGDIHIQQGVLGYGWEDGYDPAKNIPAGNKKIIIDAGAQLMVGHYSTMSNRTFTGGGSITGGNYLVVTDSTFAPTGRMFVSALSVAANSNLQINVGASTSDQLAVDNAMYGLENLSLAINIASGITPTGSFKIVDSPLYTVDYGSWVGHYGTDFSTMSFANVANDGAGLGAYNDGKWKAAVHFLSGSITVDQFAAIKAAIPGDANHSGLVDQDDYKIWYDNYGTGTTWEQGNFKGSGVTDQDDYKTWYDNYGVGTVGGAVPEPATMALLALGGLAMLRRRK